jgi:hypothetical protein
MFQSRRSLLVWKVYGERLDGFSNDDHPSEAKPGDHAHLVQHGREIDLEKNQHRYDLDYTGEPMPPSSAVREGKVKPLTDEDRRTLVRWIDLGCPIDLDYDPNHPAWRGKGWMLDDNRPILTLSVPRPGLNSPLRRLLVGMHDYDSGLDLASFTVVADFEVEGLSAGRDLAPRFRRTSQGVWELTLSEPIRRLAHGSIKVSVKDRQGNWSRLERAFAVAPGE